MSDLEQMARASGSQSFRRLNPALFQAQSALGVVQSVAVVRGPVAEADPEPEPEAPRGRTNAWSDGRRWQETIKVTAVEYERAGVLALEKTDPGVRVIGGGAARKVIFVKSRLVDFVGCYTSRGGRAVFLEVKQTHEARLPLGRPGGLTADQVATLRAWTLAGAMAAVLWREPGGAWLCPYRSVLAAALAGRKSLLPEHCRPVASVGLVRLPDGSTAERPDFAPVLAACYPKEST